jgi:hypothetical protein
VHCILIKPVLSNNLSYVTKTKSTLHNDACFIIQIQLNIHCMFFRYNFFVNFLHNYNKLETQWAVSLTFHSALRKLNTEPPIGASHHVLVIWLNRRYLEIDQSETRMACGGHVYWRIGTNWAIFIDDLPRMLPTKFRFIWQSGFREEDFLEINQLETRIAFGSHVCQRIGTKLSIFREDLP